MIKMRRIFCFILMMAMTLSMLPSISLKADAANSTYTDNKWNVLVLIYQNVKTDIYENSFSSDEINSIKQVVNDLSTTIKNLSNSRMLIGNIDTYTITTPISKVSSTGGYAGDLSVGPDGDINFDNYLQEYAYNEVVVFAPVSKYPDGNNTNWLGLGGTWYNYNDEKVFVVKINKAISSRFGTVCGKTYNIGTAAIVHEMLHSVENNSRTRGWSDFQGVHSASENGYTNENEWFAWYYDLMQDSLKSGKRGFISESFYVTHRQYPYIYTITANPSLIMREGPRASGRILTRVPNGVMVKVTEVENDWGKITYDGKTGWVNLYYCRYDGALNRYYTIAAYSALNMRDNPSSTGTKVLTSIPQGKIVKVTYFRNGWGKTTYNGKTGWIDLSYCRYKSVIDRNYIVTCGGETLAFRADHSSSTTILDRIPDGTLLHIDYFFDSWGRTTYNGKTGWVNLFYCTFNDTIDKDYTILVNGTGLNVREKHDATSEVLTTIPNGKKVHVKYFYNGWGKTTYNGKTGWIYLLCLK